FVGMAEQVLVRQASGRAGAPAGEGPMRDARGLRGLVDGGKAQEAHEVVTDVTDILVLHVQQHFVIGLYRSYSHPRLPRAAAFPRPTLSLSFDFSAEMPAPGAGCTGRTPSSR